MDLSNELLSRLNNQTLRNPLIEAEKEEACQHETQLRFHAVQAFSRKSAGSYATTFETWVCGLIGWVEKQEQFKRLLKYPLETTTVCDGIADICTKVFRAEDGYQYALFKDPENEPDFLAYLKSIKESEFWHRDGLNAALHSPHTLLVVDLPAEPTNRAIEPYYYTVDLSRLLDLELNDEAQPNWVLFSLPNDSDTGDELAAGIDSANYYRFRKAKQQAGAIPEWMLDGQPAMHGLPYAPVRFLWNDSIDNGIRRQGILTSIAAKLDWFQFWHTSKKLNDITSSYPILWMYETKCEYNHPQWGTCNDGFIQYLPEGGDNYIEKPCPACVERKMIGSPGTLLGMPMPNGTTQTPAVTAPAGFILPPVEASTWIAGEEERLKAALIEAATSNRGDLMNSQAVNRDQVEQHSTDENAVLRYLSDGLSECRTWLWDTIGRMKYGDQWGGAILSFGKVFGTPNAADLAKEYSDAKMSGLPVSSLGLIRKKLLQAQAQGNPRQGQRLDLLEALEPYPDQSLNECFALGIHQSNPDRFALKAEFNQRINWFEAEHGDILLYMEEADEIKRLQSITEILISYGRDQNPIGGQPVSPDPNTRTASPAVA